MIPRASLRGSRIAAPVAFALAFTLGLGIAGGARAAGHLNVVTISGSIKDWGKVKKIVMSGGATVNPYWPQAIANTCGVIVKTVKFSEFTAYGAALSAGLAAGFDKSKNGWPGDVEVAVFKPE